MPPLRRRTWITLLAVVGGLALGVGLTLALTRGGDAGTPLADAGEPDDLNAPEVLDAPPGADAPNPRPAVEGFLDAEIARDFTTSFGFLSAGARAEYASPARWIANHADVLPPIVSYEIEGIEGGGDGQSRAEVVALVTAIPSLDQVVGLVPERLRVRWVTFATDGSWGVDLAASSFEPLYPPVEEAAPAVQKWAEATQACAEAPTWEGNLIGSPALAESLCGADGEVRVDGADPPDDVEVAPLLAAFGPEAGEWARVVPVRAPVALKVVVAPIGQQWLVIGVLPPD